MKIKEKKEDMSVSQATSTLIGLILQMPPQKIMDLLHYVKRQSESEEHNASNPPVSEVVFSVDKRFCRGIARSIDTNGIFIETQENFYPGRSITLSYENRDMGRQVKATGKIIMVSMEGIDVAFDKIN